MYLGQAKENLEHININRFQVQLEEKWKMKAEAKK